MNKDTLQELIDQGKSIAKISEATGKGKSTVTYWMKKYGLKTVIPYCNKGYHRTEMKCLLCGEEDPSCFYSDMRQKCKKCFVAASTQRKSDQRKKIVEHMGGKCSRCSYDKYIGALDLHHKDPCEKDPNMDNINGWSWGRIEEEMKKCILVCSNCHREIHNEILVALEA